MSNITVLDSIMGSGKTTYILRMLNEAHAEDLGRSFQSDDYVPRRFLVVVPLLSEVERYQEACPELRFKDPQPVHGQKLYHLDKLIDEGANIVTTHALFKLLDRSMYEKLTEQNYTLVVDEVLDCVDMYKGLKPADRRLLFDSQMVYVDKVSRRLCWNDEKHPRYKGKFDDIKKLCDTGSLVFMSETMLIWEFPSEFLRCFEDVIVCTYLFHGSAFCAYLQAEGFTINMKSVVEGQLTNWDPDKTDKEAKARLSKLITIYNGSMNDIGRQVPMRNPLSSTWYRKATPQDLKRLKSSMETFFGRVAGTRSAHNGWTAFSDSRAALSGKGYARGWIPNNAKATNDFVDKRSMAYLCNWFFHPVIKRYFEERGVEVNEEAYALSSMLQWLWRARIRRYEPIHVFIPSERMRELLKGWLAGRGVPICRQGSTMVNMAA